LYGQFARSLADFKTKTVSMKLKLVYSKYTAQKDNMNNITRSKNMRMKTEALIEIKKKIMHLLVTRINLCISASI